MNGVCHLFILIDNEKEWKAAMLYDRKVKDDMFTFIDAVVTQNILELRIKNHANKEDETIEYDNKVQNVATSTTDFYKKNE